MLGQEYPGGTQLSRQCAYVNPTAAAQRHQGKFAGIEALPYGNQPDTFHHLRGHYSVYAQSRIANGNSQRVGDLFRNYRMRSEEHTSELQSLMRISYAVFCLKKKNK